jgi:hypothetical protein
MGHTMAVWKILEDLLIVLRKEGVHVPSHIMEDLRAARSMIDLSNSKDSHSESVAKAEVFTTNVEAYLIGQAQEVLGITVMGEWLKRLKEAVNLQQVAKEESGGDDGQFVIGVPRDQKWIRIETGNNLPEESAFKLAKKLKLTVNKQTDGRLMVHGQLDDVKAFVKQIAAMANSV